MRTIIAGSRNIVRPSDAVILAMYNCGWVPSTVICGCADGIDQFGYHWARSKHIPVEFFPAWPRQHRWASLVVLPPEIIHPLPAIKGKGAGYARNTMMADHSQALVAVWDGISRGTENMINIATNKGLKVFVARV